MDRHTASVSKTAIASDIHQSLDVHLDFTPQVAFDNEIALNDFTQASDLGVRQIAHACSRINVYLIEDCGAGRIPNAVDVGQANVDRFVSWNINTGNTSHLIPFSAWLLALTLFVLWIHADHAHNAVTLNDLAPLAAAFD
jgi:hypothetical protein